MGSLSPFFSIYELSSAATLAFNAVFSAESSCIALIIGEINSVYLKPYLSNGVSSAFPSPSSVIVSLQKPAKSVADLLIVPRTDSISWAISQ